MLEGTSANTNNGSESTSSLNNLSSEILIPQSPAPCEQSHRLNIKCNAEYCLCPDGRNTNTRSANWELIICNICDTKAAHRPCVNLTDPNSDQWQCRDCQGIFQSTEKGFYETEPSSVDWNHDNVLITSQYDTHEPPIADKDTNLNNIKFNLKFRSSGGKFKCDYSNCNASLKTIYSLIRHKKIHTKQAATITTSSVDWNDDVLITSEYDTDEPPIADKDTNLNNIQFNLNPRSSGGKFKCDYSNCNASLSSVHSLIRHKKIHTKPSATITTSSGDWNDDDVLITSEYDTDELPIADKKTNLNNSQFNLKLRSSGRKFKCDYSNCNASLKTVHSLIRHKKIHTKQSATITTSSVDWNDDDVLITSEYDTDEPPIADKNTNLNNSQFNLNPRSSGGKFKCDYSNCNASLSSVHSLIRHKKIHDKEQNLDKRYKCYYKDCDFSFSYLSDLKRHKERHKKQLKQLIQSYKFDIADASFEIPPLTDKYSKKEIKHGKFKPFKCDFFNCKSTFTRKCDLERHTKCVHNKNINANNVKDNTNELSASMEQSTVDLSLDHGLSSNMVITNSNSNLSVRSIRLSNSFETERCLAKEAYAMIKPCSIDLSRNNVLFSSQPDNLVITYDNLRPRQQKKTKLDYTTCEETFLRSSKISNDKLINSVYKPFKCAIDGCNGAFTVSELLISHQKDHKSIVK